MDGTAIKAMMAEIAPVIRDFVAEAQSPLLERISSLETEKAALAARCDGLEEANHKTPEIDLTGVEKLIQNEIAKIPPAEPPKEVDREELAQLVNEAVAVLPPPRDGKSVDLEDVLPVIAAEVQKAFSAIPIPKDGEPGKDAAGIVEALKDAGELVLTLQDGRLIRTGIRDGEKGEPGRDGFSLQDFDVQREDDGRTLVLSFDAGEIRHEYEIIMPHIAYCGIYKQDHDYMVGDVVTWGGCAWHCDQPTKEKPDVGPWTLMVKKGRDGKDAKP